MERQVYQNLIPYSDRFFHNPIGFVKKAVYTTKKQENLNGLSASSFLAGFLPDCFIFYLLNKPTMASQICWKKSPTLSSTPLSFAC